MKSLRSWAPRSPLWTPFAVDLDHSHADHFGYGGCNLRSQTNAVTGVGYLDGEHQNCVGHSTKCLTQRVGTPDINTVRTQSRGRGNHLSQGAPTYTARGRGKHDCGIDQHS